MNNVQVPLLLIGMIHSVYHPHVMIRKKLGKELILNGT